METSNRQMPPTPSSYLRHTRLHENKYRSPDAIFRTIDHQLRNKIQSFRDVDPILTSKMMQTFENSKGSPLHLPSRSRLNQLLYR
ncbi:hypothetical protein Bca52824_086133 [Brassica carinata]|uniref:Uncharacterized protein n=1 Tax=Brassica carinata TaxID=52824 RepID=A0A8X7P831_BRACI|nr:hypothetical protein Bca52824_086133 [Brassica carinata]